jgi:hypothetical protein
MRRVIFVATALCLVGCATITRGTTQVVAIDTPGVVGATCTASTSIGPQIVTTPSTLVLAKGMASIPVRCTKECYQDGAGIIASGVEPMAAGNLIVGGVIGIGVDAMSGAMNKYPDQITIPMVVDLACKKPALAPVTTSRLKR